MVNKKTDRQSIVFKIVFIVLVLRIFFLILVPPFIGIANNGDFERMMSPVGLSYPQNIWENDETHYEYTWHWVTNNYIFSNPTDNGWHQVFEVFPQIAILLSNKIQNGHFDIRFMGMTNAFFYVLSLYMVFLLIKRINGRWKYLILGAAVLVLGDSYILQYFNSFYTECGTVTFTLMLWCMQIYGFLELGRLESWKKVLFFIIYFCVAIFAILSKQQDILCILPLIIISYLLFKCCDIGMMYRWIWMALLVITIGMLFKSNDAGGNITAFNVISCDFLPNSENPELRLKELGLSDDETEIVMGEIGKNAFSATYDWKMLDNRFNRKAELQILAKEPIIMGKMLQKRCRNLFIDTTLGNYTKDSGAIEGEKTTESRIWYTFKNRLYNHSLWFYSLVILTSIVLTVIGLQGYSRYGIRRELLYVFLMLPISNVIRLISVILGDGSFDDIKHFYFINFEFDIIFITSIVILFIITRYYIKKMKIDEVVKTFILNHCKIAMIFTFMLVLICCIISGVTWIKKGEASIGDTFDSMKFEKGAYPDGWLSRNSEFKVRTGEEGIINLSLSIPNVADDDEIVIYVNNRKVYQEEINEDNLDITLQGKHNRVNKVKIHTTAYMPVSNGDQRQLSMLITDLSTE